MNGLRQLSHHVIFLVSSKREPFPCSQLQDFEPLDSVLGPAWTKQLLQSARVSCIPRRWLDRPTGYTSWKIMEPSHSESALCLEAMPLPRQKTPPGRDFWQSGNGPAYTGHSAFPTAPATPAITLMAQNQLTVIVHARAGHVKNLIDQ